MTGLNKPCVSFTIMAHIYLCSWLPPPFCLQMFAASCFVFMPETCAQVCVCVAVRSCTVEEPLIYKTWRQTVGRAAFFNVWYASFPVFLMTDMFFFYFIFLFFQLVSDFLTEEQGRWHDVTKMKNALFTLCPFFSLALISTSLCSKVKISDSPGGCTVTTDLSIHQHCTFIVNTGSAGLFPGFIWKVLVLTFPV